MKANRVLEEIKAQVDIVDFISDYVQLKKTGQNYKGLCPFHSEKTPSFMVSQSKQIFHCFGCGIGGDVVSFFMKQENVSFGEAVRSIAKQAGINIGDFRPAQDDLSNKRGKIIQIHHDAMHFFIKTLAESDVPQKYLRDRGIDEESSNRFSLGFALNARAALYQHLKKRGYDDSEIREAGLTVSDKKGYRDMFRNRIVFPICNIQNDIIAFGGRVMDNSLPKYLNSPDTEVFKKGETLFGLNIAKDAMRKKGYALIVEGYFDVVVCHQYGFTNTIAPLGTALTSRHLQRLKSQTRKVVLVFDSDEAGISAARRSLSILCEHNFRARVLLLPKSEDPDSFIRKNGSRPFKKMLSHAMSMVEFILNTGHGDKVDIVREALEMISFATDLLVAEEMVSELTDRTRVNEAVLRSELKRMKGKKGTYKSEENKKVQKVAHREEYLLLSALLAFPEKAQAFLSRIDIEDIKDKRIQSILRKIKMLEKYVTAETLLDSADDKEKALIAEVSLNPSFDTERVEENIDDCLRTLLQRRFEDRKRLAKEKEPHDVHLHNILLEEKRRLIKRKSQ